ncbi:unnamed protein product [Caenorhabditis angaria]|uniref:Uncharacterized protein n=1 Tax=Caenorhabditis angaria TaxID=860376 RepID=A0A9P1IM31_9PELO|nr:unnamed protein product [Caenorhabditis angaria]
MNIVFSLLLLIINFEAFHSTSSTRNDTLQFEFDLYCKFMETRPFFNFEMKIVEVDFGENDVIIPPTKKKFTDIMSFVKYWGYQCGDGESTDYYWLAFFEHNCTENGQTRQEVLSQNTKQHLEVGVDTRISFKIDLSDFDSNKVQSSIKYERLEKRKN